MQRNTAERRPRWRRSPPRCAARGSRSARPNRAARCCRSAARRPVVSAALGTPLESVQAPGESAPAIVNTASPQVPSSLAGVVTGVVGLDGLFREHAMLERAIRRRRRAPAPESVPERRQRPPRPAAGPQTPTPVAHAGSPQACADGPAGQRRRHLHLHRARLHLRARPALRAGPHRHRADHRHRGVRAVRGERLRGLSGLLRAVQPDPQRARRRGAGGPARATRRGGARHRARRRQRALRLPRRLRGAQRQRRAGLRPLQPDRQRRQRAGRHDKLGRCASRTCPPATARPRTAISSGWPCRGRR